MLGRLINRYSRIPVTQTLYNSNLPLTRNNLHFPSDRFLYNFTLDNSNFFLFPLKVRMTGSRLYIYLAVQKSCKRSGFYISYLTLIPKRQFNYSSLSSTLGMFITFYNILQTALLRGTQREYSIALLKVF